MMKQLLKFTVFILLSGIVILISCKKELSCEGCNEGNKPPIANAGADQTIALPKDSVLLDGSASTDPDGTITSYKWIKISGPASATIVNEASSKTTVRSLVAGVYQFELEVTDAAGLFSKDRMQLTVNVANVPYVCGDTNRLKKYVELISIGSLSQRRAGLTMIAAGNKILFAGGLKSDNPVTSESWGSKRVDIYDILVNTWSTAELSEGRWSIGATASGNKIFFAGGQMGDGAHPVHYSNIDIYDASSGTWTLKHLSEPRGYVAAAALGNLVYFAGGEKNFNYDVSSTIDIYNITSGIFNTSNLGSARAHVSAVAANNKIYFAGGSGDNRWYNSPSEMIDIFDNTTNTWTASSLSHRMNCPTGITLGDKIYWASDCTVETKDIGSWASSLAHPFTEMRVDVQSVRKDNYILFIGGLRNGGYNNKFDIYDTSTQTWSVGVSPVKIVTAVSHNNTVYVTDGVEVYKMKL